MLFYFLKFSACLAIFLAFYKLFLEKESIHHFKRYYLLISIAISFCIPLITFITYVTPIITDSVVLAPTTTDEILSQKIDLQHTVNYWHVILWSIYGLGVLIFGWTFFKNLLQLIIKIQRHPKKIQSKIIYVLLNENTIPHTFFKYIFFNKQKFENNAIPKEVFWHEETHAKQKHSLDILFIEILQLLFWFNPLIYIAKSSIKLNHEFLADQGVLNKGVPAVLYQETLLAFSLKTRESHLSSAFNYSFIKKRFTIMKTQTSKRSLWLRSLFLLPLLAFVLYSFSARKIVEVSPDPQTDLEKTTASPESTQEKEDTSIVARSISIKILTEDIFEVDGVKTSKQSLAKTLAGLHKDLTKQQRDDVINIHISSPQIITYEDLVFTQKVATDYGYFRIVTPYEEIIRSKGNTPMKKAPDDITIYVNHLGKLFINGESHSLKSIEKLIKGSSKENLKVQLNFEKGIAKKQATEISEKIKILLRANGISKMNLKHISEIKKSSDQDKATPSQIKEYNKLARHYNNLPKDKQVIKLEDINRMRELYNLMSEKQKKNAEPFPDLPPPPPPPTKDSKIQGAYLLKNIEYPAALPKNATPEQKRSHAEAVEAYKKQGYGYKYKDGDKEITLIVNDIAPPPPPVKKRPPAPPEPKLKKAAKKSKKQEKAAPATLKQIAVLDTKKKEETIKKFNANYKKVALQQQSKKLPKTDVIYIDKAKKDAKYHAHIQDLIKKNLADSSEKKEPLKVQFIPPVNKQQGAYLDKLITYNEVVKDFSQQGLKTNDGLLIQYHELQNMYKNFTQEEKSTYGLFPPSIPPGSKK